MYSRFSSGQGRQVSIPEHYSGYAFSEKTREKEALEDAPTEALSPPEPSSNDSPAKTTENAVIPVGNALQRLLSHSRLPGALEGDRLLLLGMILLLADSEADRDILLWLVLLLFCK